MSARAVPLHVPTPLRGMDVSRRYFEGPTRCWIVPVMPGDFYVSRNDEIIATVLGSCVAACMRDPAGGIGGINHFLLPEDPSRGPSGAASTRYGLYALERLINTLTRNGARRRSLEVKIFGGGQVLSSKTDIGRLNIEFVRRYLEEEGLAIVAEDVGQSYARRLRYHPLTGAATVRRVLVADLKQIAEQENETARRLLQKAKRGGDIEIF
jgi:chemotaxis protein CheD